MDTDQSLALEFSSVDDLIKHGFKNLVEAIKHSNTLPSGTNHDFYNTNACFNKLLMEDGGRILKLLNHVLKSQNVPESVFNRTNDERLEILIDANDQILEVVANMIDDYKGIMKIPQKQVEIETVSARLPINGSWNRICNARISSAAGLPQQHLHPDTTSSTVNLISAKNILRPQKFFKDKIDNSNIYPWQPRITDKPNSLKPLAHYMEDSECGPIYSHPYETELEKFKPLAETLTKCAPIEYGELNSTPLIEVSTYDALEVMLGALRGAKEIAVDLEHHSYRTFMGITCLMQISIPGKDYLVDTLILRDKLEILNEVFTKESIVKIFHGADSDILWLQRDLSLYIVNLFDTHQAAILLNYRTRSLAYLLTKFCKFAPNKHFQLADWRIRPLPDELKNYAREDTHYLIYIYHMMRNELIDLGKGDNHLLQVAFERSTDICLKKYIKPIYTEDSHLKFYRNCKRFFDNRQLFALKDIFGWRDNIAREEDESTSYVLPNHMMLQICESLPREMQGIFACCNPVPPLLRANALEIHNLILKARDQPLEKAILKEDNRAKGSTSKFSRFNMDGPLHCPHDIIRAVEFCADLPTLFNNSNYIPLDAQIVDLNIQKSHSVYSVFDTDDHICDGKEANILRKLSFLGPYERYKLVKPFVQAEEEKEQEKLKKQQEIIDKNAELSIEERIALLKTGCSTISPVRPINDSSAVPDKTKVAIQEKFDKLTAKLQSLRQQYPNTKRKRRPSFEIEDADGYDKDLTSTLPNLSSEMSSNPRKRHRNEQQEIDHKHNKRQRRTGQNNANLNRNHEIPSRNDDSKIIQNQNQSQGRSRRIKNRNRRDHANQDKVVNNSDSGRFQPFDYGTIDFKRFGNMPSQSSSNAKQNQIKSQFRGRGQGKKKFRGKNTNKSAQFYKNERK